MMRRIGGSPFSRVMPRSSRRGSRSTAGTSLALMPTRPWSSMRPRRVAAGSFVPMGRARRPISRSTADASRKRSIWSRLRWTRRLRGLTGAWLARVEAEAKARRGDADGCRAAIERSRELLSETKHDEGVPWVAYFADPAHLDRAEGRCLVQLGDAEAARVALLRSLAIGGPFVRARSGALAEISLTFVIGRDPDPDQAAEVALQALEITKATGSRRNLERLNEVAARLIPWRARPLVRELRAELQVAS